MVFNAQQLHMKCVHMSLYFVSYEFKTSHYIGHALWYICGSWNSSVVLYGSIDYNLMFVIHVLKSLNKPIECSVYFRHV